MSKSKPFGWNLPPGLTQKALDDYLDGGKRCPECDDAMPEDWKGERCTQCECFECGQVDMGQGIKHALWCPEGPEPQEPEYDDAA